MQAVILVNLRIHTAPKIFSLKSNRASFFWLALFLTIAGCQQATSFQLVADQQSAYQIHIAADADSLTQLAAAEVRFYIHAISGAELPVVTALTPGKSYIHIGAAVYDQPGALDTLHEDGFVIRTVDRDLYLSGHSPKADLYAAYDFIDRELGCRKFSAEEEYIPKKQTITLEQMHRVEEPSFSLRKMDFPGAFDGKYANWHRTEMLDDWGNFVHTFQDLVPAAVYFEHHPEYFSLIGGRRLSDSQLCLSNPDLIALLKQRLSEEMALQPEKKYWSVSQNDCFNACECAHCQALYAQYGGFSGAYVHMANQLAEAFPDKQISTLAYNFTRSAPAGIRPLPNVNIMFCSIECNRGKPLIADETSLDFVQDMENWSKLTDNIFAWDYVVQFQNYLCPFPNFHTLQPNLQFFYDHGVDIMFEQGSGHSWSDLVELKQYLTAELMWDVNADLEQLTAQFLKDYYGPAAPFIEQYLTKGDSAMLRYADHERLDIYGFPMDYVDSFLSPELLMTYRKLMDDAQHAVQTDSVLLRRVLKTRTAVDFAYLDIALNLDSGRLSYFDRSGDTPVIRPEMLAYLDEMVDNARYTRANIVNEKLLTTDQYAKYVRRKLDMMTAPNLAKNAEIQILTKYSENYPVGGPLALTDGIIGGLDYHTKWLGFEGQDMLLNIDLGEAQTVESVRMNFLKAVNSWTFLPTDVVVEVSQDGIHFREAAALHPGPDPDHGFLVESVPFQLDFVPVKTKFIRVKATSLRQCPPWHRGFGNPSWIFIDELIVQ